VGATGEPAKSAPAYTHPPKPRGSLCEAPETPGVASAT
jgi:hypothetical protein